MAKKRKAQGISKARNIQKKRSKRSKASDLSRTAKKVYRKKSNKNISAWSKNKNRSDIQGIDTKKRVKKK